MGNVGAWWELAKQALLKEVPCKLDANERRACVDSRGRWRMDAGKGIVGVQRRRGSSSGREGYDERK